MIKKIIHSFLGLLTVVLICSYVYGYTQRTPEERYEIESSKFSGKLSIQRVEDLKQSCRVIVYDNGYGSAMSLIGCIDK